MAKEKKDKKMKAKGSAVAAEFKAFITRGNVVDLAVGVIIGGAFRAIVTALVNVLLSLCTWAVPGGLKGLVTPLPAFPGNAGQAGIDGIGQKFEASEIVQATITYAQTQGATITKDSDKFLDWQTSLLSKYTAHGTTYYFNGTALIDWGTFINAVISFLVIALVLFIIVKSIAKAKAMNDQLKAKAQEDYYKLHPEERPAPVVPGVPAPTEMDVLIQIRDELKKQNAAPAEQK